MDSLMISAVIIVILLIVVVVMLTRQQASTDKKLNRLAKQFSLMQYNENAREFCRHINEKYPELCAGTDYFLKEKGDDIVIEEWNSDLPPPVNPRKD